MARNIVVLIDGTGQALQANETNVLRLARIATGLPGQVTFYDPGVGTQGAPSLDPFDLAEMRKFAGLMFGGGLFGKVEAAYRFLMRAYADSDRLYLFGFSRGAFAVRALAGMLNKAGLLERGREDLVPYLAELYATADDDAPVERLRGSFCDRQPEVHFLGLWATVKSLYRLDFGRIASVSLPWTFHNPRVRTVRHALAIDERRASFRPNRWSDAPGSDVRQVWFAGCHTDVGGGFPDAQAGLSTITLQWLLVEAALAGLLVDAARAAQVLAEAPPDSAAPLHESLRGFWRVAELVPTHAYKGPDSDARGGWRAPLGAPRFIPDGSLIHQSVLDRIAAVGSYRPPNLPRTYTVEPLVSAPPR